MTSYITNFVRSISRASSYSSLREEEEDVESEADYIYLPNELVLSIISYIPKSPASQSTLYNICLVNRQWYQIAIARLYEDPYITGSNYDLLVRTLCPSINAHIRKSPLTRLVKRLDLSRLVHHSSKSTTARLLGRTKPSLEVFCAPQASFAINCLAALSKCSNLRILDLSLISEAINIADLFHALSKLPEITDLNFPRSASLGCSLDPSMLQWPPKLTRLGFSGGIKDRFLNKLSNDQQTKLPTTLKSVRMEYCPFIAPSTFIQFVRTLRFQLEELSVANMPRFSNGTCDYLLYVLQKLTHLSVSMDYITSLIVSPITSGKEPLLVHPLEILTISYSGGTLADDTSRLNPGDIRKSVVKGYLPNLRTVIVAEHLGWDRMYSEQQGSDELTDLDEVLFEREEIRRGLIKEGEKMGQEERLKWRVEEEAMWPDVLPVGYHEVDGDAVYELTRYVLTP